MTGRRFGVGEGNDPLNELERQDGERHGRAVHCYERVFSAYFHSLGRRGRRTREFRLD